MPKKDITIAETDIIKLVLEFMQSRDLAISTLSLERESGVINGLFSDDMLFLRQLILDGQWDDVIDFIQPLEKVDSFNMCQFRYLILKHKYLELLCLKSEPGPMQNHEFTVDEVVQCLNEIEQYAPSPEDHNNLCLLLTQPRLSDHVNYTNWNPSKARLQCFTDVYPLVENLLPLDGKMIDSKMAKNDRLVQLLVKGLLYESCVEFCQQKATCEQKNVQLVVPKLLNADTLGDSDLSLMSWLQCLPQDTFGCPFEQSALNISLTPLKMPSLEASWSEQILVTPIKPKMFPHSAIQSSRPKSAELLSKSLNPNSDALSLSLIHPATQGYRLNNLSRSFGAFHADSSLVLASINENLMNSSIDKLFENDVGKGSPRLGRTITNMKPNNVPIQEIAQSSPLPSASGSTPPMSPKVTQTVAVLSQSLSNEREDQMFIDSNLISFSPLQAVAHSTKLPRTNKLLDSSSNRSSDSSMLMNRTPDINTTTDTNMIPESSASPVQVPLTPGSHILAQMRSLAASRDRVESEPSRGLYNKYQSNKLQQEQQHQSPYRINERSPSYSMNQQKTSYEMNQQRLNRPRFLPVTSLEDVQAIRSACFHPDGHMYAVGSNSKSLRICSFPDVSELRHDHVCKQANVVFKRNNHHKGSIYCIGWSDHADLIATGSNDKTIKVIKFNPETCNITDADIELKYHDGTIRDLIFIQDGTNPLVVSGGAGDCKIYVADMQKLVPIRAMTGHKGHIYSLYHWGSHMFVSGSQDNTCMFWDVRMPVPINVVHCPSPVSAFASVAVDPTGNLLASGHENAMCMLYDIRGGRPLQLLKFHSNEVRTVRFSMNAYYLLTGSYDGRIMLTDIRGDLEDSLPSVIAAEHEDKVIQCRWHPSQLSFLSSSADRTVNCWALPAV